ncbi:MAG: M20 family metallopeptidase [Bacillota bacterium]
MQDNLMEQIEKLCRSQQIVEITRSILGIPSPQTELFENEPLVQQFIVNTVKPYVEQLGLKVRLDKMGNLIATLGEGASGIILVGYAMTPQAGSMEDGYVGQIVPGEKYGYLSECLRGRGSCEQKGALGAMLGALEIIAARKENLKGTLTFICSTAGETGRHDSLDYILNNGGIKGELAVVGLGTFNEICLGNKGRIDVLIDVYGKSCHSSVPHQGINAIEGAAEVLNTLRTLKPGIIHPHFGMSTFAPMHIESFPRATHTIQNKCTISYDRRLVPGEDPQEALEEIRKALSQIERYPIEVKAGPFMYPSEIDKEAKLAGLFANAVKAVTGKEAAFTYFNSALDAGLLNRRGIETLMFGPGNVKFAHTDEEVVTIEQLIEAAKIYAYVVLDYLG